MDMARFRDIISAARDYGVWSFLKRLYREISEDNVFTNAAAMAYAWMFAIFPFMIAIMTLLPYIPEHFRQDAKEMTQRMLADSLTQEASKTLMEQWDTVVNQPQGGLLSLGLFLTLFAASGGMNATMSALDQAFDIDKPRKYIWKRIIAVFLTLFMCLCLLIIIAAIPVGSMVTGIIMRYFDQLPDWAQDWFSGSSLVLFTVARYIIGLTVMQILIGVIYHFGRSKRENRIRFFSPGSIFAALGWIGTGLAMRFYVENFANYSKTYGAVAGMVVMLMVFYINAVIILVGAELDNELRRVRRELASEPQGQAPTSGPTI